ncbi:MAG: glycosyltransferase family 9 protein, partial [Opitutaceae bacterium]
ACAAAGFSNVTIKTWPPDHFARIAAWLDKEMNVPVLLLGHVSERDYLERIKTAAGTERVKIWLGKADDLPLLAALLAVARLYFGNDTGAMHLAAAAGIPVAGLFGGGTWPRFRPAAKRSIDLVCPMPCFGCEWDCAFGDAPCVGAIHEDAVREALTDLLQSGDAGGCEIRTLDLPATLLNSLIKNASDHSHRKSDQLRLRQGEFERTVRLASLKDAEIANLKAAANSKDTDLVRLSGELERQAGEMATLRAACQERLELIIHLDKTVKNLVIERSNLTAEAATLRQECATSKKKALETEELYKRLSPDASQWARQLAEAEEKAATLQKQIDAMREELRVTQSNLKEREASLDNIAGGMGSLEVHKYYQRLLRDKENVLQELHSACQERESLIRKLAMAATTPTAKLHKLLTGIRGLWNARVALPLRMQLEKRLLEGYWMQLGQLHQHEPRPVAWDRRLASQRPTQGKAPRIGIVTPSFNQAAFLERTIRSILGQEYPGLRYVIQDGASGDGSAEIIARHSPRLHAWESAKDAGQADAIRRGFAKLADSLDPEDVMAWVNSDDLLAPGCLRFVGRYFERHPEADVIYGHRIVIDALDREIGRWVMPPHNRETLRWIDFIPQETLFWRKRAWDRIGGLDPGYQFALDWDFLLRIQDSGTKLVRVPCFLGAFRVHDGSKTSSLIHTNGTREMDRVRQRVHGASFDRSRLDAEVRRAQFDGAIAARLLALGIRR